MAPRTAYWPRDDDSGARKYNHVNASECVPTSAAKGECGACHAKDVDRCSINDSGQDIDDESKVCATLFIRFTPYWLVLTEGNACAAAISAVTYLSCFLFVVDCPCRA